MKLPKINFQEKLNLKWQVIITTFDTGLKDNEIIMISEEPSKEELDKIVFQTITDTIYAIGGGSAIDWAKYLCNKEGKKLIAIPTTFSGSASSSHLVLKENWKKKGYSGNEYIPDEVIIINDLLYTLPAKTFFYSLIDCFAHSQEAVRSNKNNFIIELISENIIGTFGNVLQMKFEDFIKLDENKMEEEKALLVRDFGKVLLVISLYASYILSEAGTNLPHAISYAISNYGLSHWEAIAIVYGLNDRRMKDLWIEFDLEKMTDEILLDRHHLDNFPWEISKDLIFNTLKKLYE